MRRLLWVGDAACDSGFARCTHKTLDVLRRTWDVTVIGLNYFGDPHAYPYPIYPAWRPGGDPFGVRRIAELTEKTKPQAIVIQNDPWNIPNYIQALREYRGKIVGAIAVDGLNCNGRALNGLDRVIFWTRFAQEEATRGGLTKPSGVVPLGVDLDVYQPGDRIAARERLGMPEVPTDAFIVGNVNRNQPRKRLDLTIAYFAEWIRSKKIDDAYLYLHIAPTGDMGWDCGQLAQFYGIAHRLIIAEPAIFKGISEANLAKTYQAFNVLISTTQGEGWGLTAMEAMACGIPCILPSWSAFQEWAEAAFLVPCTSIATTPNKTVNTIGGVPDREATIDALDQLYNEPLAYKLCRDQGLALVAREAYQWESIGQAFAAELETAVHGYSQS